MTILAVTGWGGMLGQAMTREIPPAQLRLLDWRLLEGGGAAACEAFAVLQPDWVIHCAAHTDVEQAERDPDTDYRANVALPARLAELCAQAGAGLVHVSSTGCYGAWKDTPYVETDRGQPTTVHHRHKLAGEQAVRQSGCRHIIVRTGWLFGGDAAGPKNFVWKRIIEARQTAQMASDTSQRGVPTNCTDLARQIVHLIEAGGQGLYNATAGGSASRYDYVAEIVRLAQIECRVVPGPAFPRLAPVSPNETAINQRLDDEGMNLMRDWRDGLADYVADLLEAERCNG
ncbi:SDR family oxidoreductase [Novosphingobium aquimarinum]|uniref:SDR family oxidoreductase n=1 Tax=Novosphingobium aquimarinum TaxID=2682494 RepID=UPI0018DE9BEB|nr:NAD(P)-dependent oxidoreductase [Novosphingobium aquimarinum]